MDKNVVKCPFCGSKNTHVSLETHIKRGLGHVAEFGIGYGLGLSRFGEFGQ